MISIDNILGSIIGLISGAIFGVILWCILGIIYGSMPPLPDEWSVSIDSILNLLYTIGALPDAAIFGLLGAIIGAICDLK